MGRYSWLVIPLLLVAGCTDDASSVETEERIAAAKRFLGGVYGGDLPAVEELAAPDIVISYPIFQEIFDTPAIRGRDAVTEFARRFASRWEDARITVDEVVADGNKVVLVWSFSARAAGSAASDQPNREELTSWGGITFYRFDASGKIELEVGEESTPGPFGRLPASDSSR